MQKKLIALAIAGLASTGAFAQSNVTLSGLVRMSAEQYKLQSVPGAFDASTENRVSDQSSMLIISAKEDLGGGMYAGFTLDNRFDNSFQSGASATSGQVNNVLAGGNSNLHIGGTWGKVSMGRQDLHYGTSIESYKAYTLQNILGNALLTQISTGGSIANATRTPNVVMYDSPNISGFTARVALSSKWDATSQNEGSGLRASGAADPGKGSATNIELKYSNGPIFAGYSYWNATVEGGKGAALAPTTLAGVITASGGDQRGDTLQFSYAFPMGLKAGIAWNQSRVDTTAGDLKRSAWLIPVSYEFGANQVAFTYAKANNQSGSFTAVNNDTGASAYTLAYSRALSKRTNLGVSYSKMDNKANASYDLFGLAASAATGTSVGADSSQFAINMNHSF